MEEGLVIKAEPNCIRYILSVVVLYSYVHTPQRIQNLRFRSVFYISNETLLKKAIARDNAVLAQSSVVDPDP
jgi:hypothetical protein